MARTPCDGILNQYTGTYGDENGATPLSLKEFADNIESRVSMLP